jgi:tetratricopeptide (TPR) repeat protein
VTLRQYLVVNLLLTVSYTSWVTPIFSGVLCLTPLAAASFAAVPSSEITAAVSDRAQEHFRQGQRHHSKGNLKAAIEQYSAAIKLNPEFVNAYVARGGIFGALEEYPAAIEDYSNAIALSPELAGAYGGRGLARFRNGDNEGVQDLWQAAQLYREQDKMNDYFRTLAIIQRLDP